MRNSDSHPLDSLETLLEMIDKELLVEFAEGQGINVQTISTSSLEEVIITKFVSKGVERFFYYVPVDLWKKVLDELSISYGSRADLRVVSKLVGEAMDKFESLADFFSKLSDGLVFELLTSIGVPFKEVIGKEEMEAILEDEIILQGAYECFDVMSPEYTSEVGHKGLGIPSVNELSETQLIFSILGMCFANCVDDDNQLRQRAKKVIKRASEEPHEKEVVESIEIKKGITFDKLMSLLWRQLYVFCSDNRINPVGKKGELSQRILTFLDGDTEDQPLKKKRF
jgi:hypothetical protein